MKLPDGSNAIVEPAKLVRYLLNAAHPDNGGKAAFFERLGFTPDHQADLVQALRRVALANECAGESSSPFGMKYIVDGLLVGPNGDEGRVRTVWIREPQAPAPRLVTAYPAGRMEQPP